MNTYFYQIIAYFRSCFNSTAFEKVMLIYIFIFQPTNPDKLYFHLLLYINTISSLFSGKTHIHNVEQLNLKKHLFEKLGTLFSRK